MYTPWAVARRSFLGQKACGPGVPAAASSQEEPNREAVFAGWSGRAAARGSILGGGCGALRACPLPPGPGLPARGHGRTAGAGGGRRSPRAAATSDLFPHPLRTGSWAWVRPALARMASLYWARWLGADVRTRAHRPLRRSEDTCGRGGAGLGFALAPGAGLGRQACCRATGGAAPGRLGGQENETSLGGRVCVGAWSPAPAKKGCAHPICAP